MISRKWKCSIVGWLFLKQSCHMALEDLEYNVWFLWDTFMVLLCPFHSLLLFIFHCWTKKYSNLDIQLNNSFVFHGKEKSQVKTTWGWVDDDRIFIFPWTIPLTMDCRERKKKENERKKLIAFLIYRSQIVVIEPYFYVLKAAGSLLLARRFFLLSTLCSI